MSTTRTTCPYCGVGCGVLASAVGADSRLTRIEGDPDHPANFGRLCSKGTALGDTLGLSNRLLTPRVRGRSVDWDVALNHVAQTFTDTIEQYGPDSVAFYLSGQILTEDYYVANKLMKGYIGTANVDTNSRLCMASSVAGHKRAFGSDTVPGQYEDIEHADLVVLVGSNLAWCHPVLFQRLVAAKSARPEMRVVVIDPRRTVTADMADLHLAIAPDADVALFNGLMVWLSRHGRIDSDYVGQHTVGFEQALSAASSLTVHDISGATGLSEAQLTQFFQWFTDTERVVTVYSQGVNQSTSGTNKVGAIINCHLATGRIGRLGMGPLSATGQPNAMGGREVGGLANMLAAHTELDNPSHRSLIRRFWNSPRIAERPGLKAVDLFSAIKRGEVKAVWIMATNPVDSLPNSAEVKSALADCPFVVVSDVQSDTDTVQQATVQLPSAAWGEKDGTVTNSERRVSRQRAFMPTPDNVRPDWWQICQIASRMGFADGFNFDGPAAIFREHAALSAFENHGTRDFDIGACADLSSRDYDEMVPFCWPWRDGQPAGVTRFFATGGFYTPDRRARFVSIKVPAVTNHGPVTSERSQTNALTLNTGRIRDQWHTMTRTSLSPRLSAHLAEPFVEIHPLDAAVRGIAKADLVRLTAKPGTSTENIVVRALITDRQQPGSVFVPMHFTDQFAANARVGKLIAPWCDPISGQPALKSMPVQLSRYRAGLYGFVASRVNPAVNEFDYWVTARTEFGWRAEFACQQMPDDIDALVRALIDVDQRLEPLKRIDYADTEQSHYRTAWLTADNQLHAMVFLASDPVTVSRSWAIDQFKQPVQKKDQHKLLAGRHGSDGLDAGALVCSCLNVGKNQIERAISDGCNDVLAVGRACQAGTNCGSCRAEILALIDRVPVDPADPVELADHE